MRITLILSAILFAVSVYTDVRWRKIFNWLTFPLMAAGLILCAFPLSATPLVRLAWMAGLFLFGMTGWIGLGDLKLCMALVALRGYVEMLWTVAFGGILMLIFCMITEPGLMAQSVRGMINSVVAKRDMVPKTGKQYPFAPFLAGGWVLSVLFVRFAL